MHREPCSRHDLHVLHQLICSGIHNGEVSSCWPFCPWGLAGVSPIDPSPLASPCTKIDISSVLEVLLKGGEGGHLAIEAAQHQHRARWLLGCISEHCGKKIVCPHGGLAV